MIYQTLKNIIQSYELQTIYRYIVFYTIAIIIALAGLLFWHYRSITYNQQLLKKLAKERLETQQILTNYNLLKQQEDEVETILNQNPDFRIIEAYNNIISTLNLQNYTTGNPEPIEDRIENYIERKLAINLNNISTQQLVQLLEEIEKYERLYTKALTITNKTPKNKAIDASVVIATLDPLSNTP